ncbi:MAG: 4Fe-4S dicluster domain-containing protein [Clostridia bacterium]
MRKLLKNDLLTVLKIWNDEYEVFAPKKVDGDVVLSIFDEENFTTDYVNVTLPVKQYLFEQKENFFKWNKTEKEITVKTPDPNKLTSRVLFGVRPCDAYGVAYTDKFYFQEFEDTNYTDRRKLTAIVAVNCLQPGKNCFCTSTQTGPFAEQGYDILLTPVRDYYLVESASQFGEALLTMILAYLSPIDSEQGAKDKAILKSLAENKFEIEIDLSHIRGILKKTYDSKLWDSLAHGCISCTGCTNVCPTCTCFNVVEENIDDNSGRRVRYWDSCQSDSFTRNAGGHNTRSATSRVRFRILDKLSLIEERFAMKGCVGCGRCISVCPTYINIVKIASELTADYYTDGGTDEELEQIIQPVRHIIEQRPQMDNLYKPEIAIITRIDEETPDIKRFFFKYKDPSLHERYIFKGQFFMITVFGQGEIAISIPFGPSQRDEFDFCVKKAGKVTDALHSMQVGDEVGLRGPFGAGFPYETIKGRDILIVGSGVGLAPVRTMIVQILENRQEFGKVAIMASATKYEGVVYKDDLKEWAKIAGVQIFYPLAKPTNEVDAHVGYINDLLPGLGFDWANTTAVICASPRRIKAVAKDLLALGMQPTDILTSLETHMRCGTGKCGHCKVGSHYMCVDGPVFNYQEMLQLPPEF